MDVIAPAAVASLPVVPTPPAPAVVPVPPAQAGAASVFDALVQEFAGAAAVPVSIVPNAATAKAPAFNGNTENFKAPAAPKPVAVAGKASAPVFRAPSQPVAQPVAAQPVAAQPVAAPALPVPAPAAVVVAEPQVETPKALPAKEQQEAPQEAPAVTIPVVAAPVRRTSGVAAPPVKAGSGAAVAVPFIPIAAPAPPPLPVLPAKAGSGEGDATKPPVTQTEVSQTEVTQTEHTQTEDQKTPERWSPKDAALQVNIKMPGNFKTPNDANAVSAAGPDPLPLKQPLRAIAETPVEPVVMSAATAVAVAPAAIFPSHTAPATQATPAANVPAPRSTLPEEPLTKEPAAATPLKSLSLEFTPDGAGDVRLRVTERGGEVHISLHSSDASLGGKLHEGVRDLVGNLAKAGYDAEAWTPGQGHQGNRQQEQRRQQQPRSGEAGTDDFGNIYEQQPGQEIS